EFESFSNTNIHTPLHINVDIDEGIELVVDQEKDAEIEGRQANTQAKIYNIDLDHSSMVLSMQEDDAEVQEAVEIVTTAKLMTEVVTAATTQEEEESYVQAKDVQAKGIQYIRRYHGYKKKPQSESEARKNMIAYLKNTKAQKAAKRRRLCKQAKEAEDLKKQLEVVVDEDDDVFIEATPIGTKVPVLNYEIVIINNKPRYKIIRVDDTHQLYTSFITLLKNFDREDLEDLWKIMKARFSTFKPTNFFDDYLLVTLKTMFEKTDAQDIIWRSQQTEHGQALVEEESEMSLELLRFTKQQLLEYQQG
nr:hypothetical protein [Tanacetum cinerariifolium]